MTPRTLTSEAGLQLVADGSVFSGHQGDGVNAFWYMATASPSSSASTTQERQAEEAGAAPGRARRLLAAMCIAAHPAIRTVVVAPQMASDRNRSMMLTATIDVRTARPTATPTPAGPPLAR